MKRLLISDKWYLQVLGALLQWNHVLALFAFAAVTYFGLWIINDFNFKVTLTGTSATIVQLAALFYIGFTVISVCRTLNDIFNLRKQELNITASQIAILVAIGVMILGVIIICDLKDKKESSAGVIIAIIGSVMTWIFQDTIKGVAAFIHLRLNHLLNIGDWIQVSQYKIDGQIRRVTLTTITVYNWDTTTSSFPTSVLTSNHFMNLEKMVEGKTYGRQMEKTFVFDMNWIHPLSVEEAESLKANPKVTEFLLEDEIKPETMNIQLLRLYMLHWMMRYPYVSHQPRLLVRWLDPVATGLPLQVRAFITESFIVPFEWHQSQIVEHFIESLGWFGLRLYQSPSSFDVSNSNIYLTERPAAYKNV